MTKQTQEIIEIINHLILKFAEHPYEICNGRCDEFASELADALGGEPKDDGNEVGPLMLWGDDVPQFFNKSHDPDYHCFVKYNGKFYDAETPFGEASPAMLPFFMRQLICNPEFSNKIDEALNSRYANRRGSKLRQFL